MHGFQTALTGDSVVRHSNLYESDLMSNLELVQEFEFPNRLADFVVLRSVLDGIAL